MGMDAYVIGFGPFKKDLRPCMDYPDDYYEDVKEGKDIAVHFFICNNTEQSKELARCLGMEPWDFNTHKISYRSKGRIDVETLKELSRKSTEWDEDVVDAFMDLLEEGFVFFYLPEG